MTRKSRLVSALRHVVPAWCVRVGSLVSWLHVVPHQHGTAASIPSRRLHVVSMSLSLTAAFFFTVTFVTR